MTQTSTDTPVKAGDRKVPTRRISFEESLEDLPRHFAADGDLIASHIAAALSAVFPDGEDFFVRSVRHFRDQVTDPALKRQVAGFIGQEAMHGREHRALNDRLDALGYPTKLVERLVERGLRIRERLLTAKSNLAATAALEHFTATLAELVLTNADARDQFGHEGVKDLFIWHALEESEHKAVAFDVYKAVGGSERTRVLTMKLLRFGFVVGMSLQVVASLLGDRATYRPGNLR
ncbi:MAG TPA: metal-dependent hydrolase, partial [Acidimicrobiales bacterium]